MPQKAYMNLYEQPAVAAWRKSSFCASGECVEVGLGSHDVMMRSSLETSVVLRISADEWRAFMKGIRAGEFDNA
jgi:hypothetical protein